MDPKPKLPPLPKSARVARFMAEKPLPPGVIIEGLLEREDKMIFGSDSKARKSWLTLHLALAVSCGQDFLGFKTTKTPVLYINLELSRYNIWVRFDRLFGALRIDPKDCDLAVWNLRGHCAPIEHIAETLKADKWPYGLIVLDPLYKVLGGRQENSPEQMAELMSHLEGLTLTRKAAIVYPSHYSKGNQSEKAHIDRISGSGVLARDPDAICTLTRHQEDFCYSVEFSLRNLRPLTPFVVRWNYPLFEVVEDADPANLKTGRTRKYDDEAVLHPLHKGPLTYSDWFKALEGTTGMSQRTFDGYLGRLKRQHAVIQSATNGTYYIPRGSARGSAPDPDSE